ncbi:DNA-binding protein [Sinorhizobium medicae]|uniref:DNA-binding protein n=1 Tax=Sinorhizobium medicae TaxID=110321 RepID=UPI000FD87C60|nr:DNA-binding protein [Sinorhizobium medicae]RVJ66732.1 DNA-binding protein [Sinorhizobium medicae]
MEEVRMTLRLPADAAAYLEEKARENLTSRNAEVVRAVRERMKREQELEKGDATA